MGAYVQSVLFYLIVQTPVYFVSKHLAGLTEECHDQPNAMLV